MIGEGVAIVEGREGVALLHDHFSLPASGFFAAAFVGGAILFYAGAGAHPAFGEGDAGVGVDGVVAAEVGSEEDGDGAFGVGGEIEEQAHGGSALFAGEPDGDFAACGQTAEGFGGAGGDFVVEAFRFGRGLAVHVHGVEAEDFRAALIAPEGRRGDGLAVQECESTGELVGAYLGLVVVRVFWRLSRKARRGQQNKGQAHLFEDTASSGS